VTTFDGRLSRNMGILSAVDILNFIILGLIGPMTAASSLREIDFGMLRLRVK
jgi:hypothetical protein